MRLISIIVTLMLCASVASAQSWSAKLTRDAVYDAGSVTMPGNAMSISCAAQSPKQGSVLGSQWWEVSVAPPWQYLMVFQDQLVPNSGSQQEVDMILFADQTGYRLPTVVRNELEGGWQTMLAMTDPLFAAVSGASQLVLLVGSDTAWQLPVTGLADGLRQIRDACGATWNAIGIATPAGFAPPTAEQSIAPAAPAAPPSGFVLPPQVQSFANRECSGVASFDERALQAGDLDGDGAPDVLMDWGRVRCNGQSMRGLCGASNCQYDLFLSSRNYANPLSRLAIDVSIITHRSGRLGLQMTGTAGVCNQIDCTVPWLWNGSDFVQVP